MRSLGRGPAVKVPWAQRCLAFSFSNALRSCFSFKTNRKNPLKQHNVLTNIETTAATLLHPPNHELFVVLLLLLLCFILFLFIFFVFFVACCVSFSVENASHVNGLEKLWNSEWRKEKKIFFFGFRFVSERRENLKKNKNRGNSSAFLCDLCKGFWRADRRFVIQCKWHSVCIFVGSRAKFWIFPLAQDCCKINFTAFQRDFRGKFCDRRENLEFSVGLKWLGNRFCGNFGE